MKAANIIFLIIWIIFVPILIISVTVNVLASSEILYSWGFKENQIASKTGINESQLTEISRSMTRYLAGKSDSPQVEVVINGNTRLLYNEKELMHLQDVRDIVRLFQLLQKITLVVLIISGVLLVILKTRAIFWGALLGSLICIVIISVIIVWSILDFRSLFYLFHIISFSNDLWLLDPTKDYLIMLFPQEFFHRAAIIMVSIILAIAVFTVLLSFVGMKLWVANNKKTAFGPENR